MQHQKTEKRALYTHQHQSYTDRESTIFDGDGKKFNEKVELRARTTLNLNRTQTRGGQTNELTPFSQI